MLSIMFSGGPRGCIGKNLALIEVKVFMIKFLKRYDGLIEEEIKERKSRRMSLDLTYRVKNSVSTLIRQA